VSWNFNALTPGAHPEGAIDIIGGLGFESIELIAIKAEVCSKAASGCAVRVIVRLELKRRGLGRHFASHQQLMER